MDHHLDDVGEEAHGSLCAEVHREEKPIEVGRDGD
jgi:hypothetical protein